MKENKQWILCTHAKTVVSQPAEVCCTLKQRTTAKLKFLSKHFEADIISEVKYRIGLKGDLAS